MFARCGRGSGADRPVDEADGLEDVRQLLADVDAVRETLHVRWVLERVGHENALRAGGWIGEVRGDVRRAVLFVS